MNFIHVCLLFVAKNWEKNSCKVHNKKLFSVASLSGFPLGHLKSLTHTLFRFGNELSAEKLISKLYY